MLDEEAQTESQDNEMEQEAIIDETGVAPSSQEDDDGVLHGPALPPPSHVPIPQETNSPPPLEQEDSQPQPSCSQESSEVSHEIKLREKLVHRVHSFKISRNQSKADEVSTSNARVSVAADVALVERKKPSSRAMDMKPVEVPPPMNAAADELVVESTGEMQQDTLSGYPQPTTMVQQPVIEPSPSANTSFQADARIEPETGVMEGEPGEIMEDSMELSGDSAGASAVKMEVEEEEGGTKDSEGGVLGEEEMVRGEEEMDRGDGEEGKVKERISIPSGGKCYMDREDASEIKDNNFTKKR